MNIIKAICECKNMSETDLVIAVKDEPFSFIGKWSLWIWIGASILTLLTGGLWLGIILGVHLMDIVNPKYRCNQCGRNIAPQQFRV